MDNDLILSIMSATETTREELNRYYCCPRTDCAKNYNDCVTFQRTKKCSQSLDNISSSKGEENEKRS